MHLEKQIIKAHFDHLWAKPIGSHIFGSELPSSQREKEVIEKSPSSLQRAVSFSTLPFG